VETKDFKEVIEFLEEWNKFKPYRNSAMNITQLNKAMDSVIDLLQQGEKYRQMWEEMSNKYYSTYLYYIGELMDEIEQKYFPKENIKEVVRGITEQIKEGAEAAKEEVKTSVQPGVKNKVNCRFMSDDVWIRVR